MQEIRINVVGLLPLQHQLELLRLSPTNRRRILYRTAQKILVDSRKRVAKQVDLNGKPFGVRNRPRKDRGKMLARIAKRSRVINNDDTKATVGFTGRNNTIASAQQFGEFEVMTPEKLAERQKTKPEFYAKPATRKQAIALRKAGFKKKTGKGPAKIASFSWIMANLTIGEAGFALRKLRAWSGEKTKSSWETVLPARPFFGATEDEIKAHINKIYEQVTAQILRGH